ncbi:DUF4405 domain-containing protein [Anoxybacillus sp. LAT_35]|uniref:DUF4405 domain-containing protein n=1 Tax=Anoxybacillus TaxID=150247 RepID=UPI001EDA7A7A|nr:MULTISPECIES: DUF4405 domain-containing protein [Anoxybacillus]MCG5024649.1 DUF4405 domain-containing protein [Anoxybacillus flavithermus]MCG6198052.1 DUF4405 domain-containing protein [Anoxybacillus sp. LAT_38]MCG3085914.1 DUF4405 domain-containing protein [Anoxybacillus sp. LAT27]MCG6172710.1 DUF4405 domain-containing protein [Anoxybacillus sp. LAT_11]MCG6173346.1 DUF4405 domain-containing protein [Anoxybacillus sp. LAT_11]
MLKKNIVKIILDVSMAITFVLLMNPRVFNGLPFHEVAGLVIGVAVLVHIALNYKWVVNTTKKIFDRSLSGKTRFSFLLNISLLLSMTGIIVTGILISKVVFPHLLSGENHALREIHDVFAKLTLLLVGVHIALHWQWIMGVFRKMLKTKEGHWRKGTVVAVVFVLAMFIGSMQWLATNVKPNEEAFKPKFEQKVAQASETFPPPEKFREREFPHKEHHGNSHPLFVILGHFTFWAVVIVPVYYIEKRMRHKRQVRV